MDVWWPWAEAAGVAVLGAGGMFAGWWVSGRKYWLAVSVAGLTLVALFGLARWSPRLELVPPFSWVMAGRLEYALRVPAAALALLPAAMQLRPARQRVMVAAFLALVLGQYGVMPFLSPAFARPRLAALETVIDGNGVCLQTTPYTCGPAASVTALRRLNIRADESDLALRMHTCPALGTPADVLTATLEDRYGADGVRCEYRRFASLEDLPRGTPTLAVVKHSFMVDHFVAVLDVKPDGVVVGDPERGRVLYSRQEFERRWRFMGVVVTRASAAGRDAVASAGPFSSGSATK